MSAMVPASWTRVHDLPSEAQSALIALCSESFDGPEALEHLDEWEWRIEHEPVDALKARVMDGLLAEGEDEWATFDEYHAWYMSQDDPRQVDHGASVWPCIAEDIPDGPPIEDGWHRFHSYVAKGMAEIPMLHSRMRETS